MESGNSYQRAIQYQQLEKEQFQALHPPGFFHSVGPILYYHGTSPLYVPQQGGQSCLNRRSPAAACAAEACMNMRSLHTNLILGRCALYCCSVCL